MDNDLSYFTLLTVLLLRFSVFAQDVAKVSDSLDIKKQYIYSFDDYISGRVSLINQANTFRIGSPKETGGEIKITTKQVLRLDFSVSFRFIDLTVRFIPSILENRSDVNSDLKTSFINLGTRIYFNKWMQSFQYTRTKGFYADFSKIESNNIEYLSFPNLTLFKVIGTTSYVFNPSFSFRSIYKQNEWQKKSVGSFVTNLSYNYSRLFQNNLENDITFNITLGPSYFYNLVIGKKFLTSLGLRMGVGYHSTVISFYDNRENKKTDGLSIESEINLNVGYNSKFFYSGVLINAQSFQNAIDSNFQIEDQHQFFEFYIGYRFKAPKKLIKRANHLQEKLNL